MAPAGSRCSAGLSLTTPTAAPCTHLSACLLMCTLQLLCFCVQLSNPHGTRAAPSGGQSAGGWIARVRANRLFGRLGAASGAFVVSGDFEHRCPKNDMARRTHSHARSYAHHLGAVTPRWVASAPNSSAATQARALPAERRRAATCSGGHDWCLCFACSSIKASARAQLPHSACRFPRAAAPGRRAVRDPPWTSGAATSW